MIFVMALAARPTSAQKKGKKQRYQQNIRDAATCSIGCAKTPLLDGELYARIVYFHTIKTELDVDNIPKPILDALIGIVYDDDHRIAQCLTTRVHAQRDYTTTDNLQFSEIHEIIKNFVKEGKKHVLYIEVGPISEYHIGFGPIEGG